MIRFPEGHKIDDEFFTYQVVMNSDKVVLFDEPLYEYRMRISSVMGAAEQYEEKILLDKLEYLVERYEKVTQKFPDIVKPYLRNLMDNLIILLRKSQHYDELKPKIQIQIKKYKWKYILLSGNMKEKIGFLYSLYKPTESLKDSIFVREPMEDYFE